MLAQEFVLIGASRSSSNLSKLVDWGCILEFVNYTDTRSKCRCSHVRVRCWHIRGFFSFPGRLLVAMIRSCIIAR